MKIIQTLHKLIITLVLNVAFFFMHHKNRILLINYERRQKTFPASDDLEKTGSHFIKTFMLVKQEKVCVTNKNILLA